MRVHVVANPTAGRGRTPRLVADLERALVAHGAVVTTYATTGPGDASRHVASLDAAALDRLVVLGGDGTLHEVVQGRLPLPWPVAVVPLGTANLVARDAGVALAGSADARARAVIEAEPWAVDVLESDRGVVLATAGAGLDADVVNAVARVRSGGRGGYSRWIFPIARTFLAWRPRKLHVVVDGVSVEGGAVIIQNTRCYGGLFTLSPTACMDDGRLDVVVSLDALRRDQFRMLATAFLGRVQHDRRIRVLSGTRVEVYADRPVLVQTDGDPAGTTPFRAQVRRGGLTLLRPRR